jgi:hypothetical protein
MSSNKAENKEANSTEQETTQVRFIKMVKSRLLPGRMLVDEIADALNISYDSAYRRIRGDKPMSIDEVVLLSQIYGISLESLGTAGTDSITFSFRTLDNKNFTFRQYLESQINQFKLIGQAKEKEIIYAAKDMPVYHYYNFNELTQFKTFVWKKTIMGLKEYEDLQFSFEDSDQVEQDLCKKALLGYSSISGAEIWNEETVNSTLRQILIYHQMGVFKDTAEALVLLDQFEKMVKHINRQAVEGKKFLLDADPDAATSTFQLYNNELVLCDNSIYASVDGQKMAFLTHNTLNYLHIVNKEYCEVTYKWMKNLIRRSTAISSASEKERIQFFNGIYNKINKLKTQLESSIN